MHITEKRTQLILEIIADRYFAEWAEQYGEPGYGPAHSGVVLANWNNVPSRLADYLDAAGFELEWSDEWIITYRQTSKAWRVQPDSYGWQSSVMVTDDGEIITPDDGASEFIAECLMTDWNQPTSALPDWVKEADLVEAGFSKFNGESFENGWHPGQADKPEEIAHQLFEMGADSVVFQLDSVGQFDVRFSAWYAGELESDTEDQTDQTEGA